LRLILDPSVRLFHGGRTLVARGRVIRLSEHGPAALRALLADTATPAQQRLGERLVDAGFAHPRPAPKRIDATVVIPVKDDAAALGRCLAALPRVADPARVLVVDDGSSDAAAISAASAGAALVRRPNGGPAAARNTGVAQVTTPFVAFLDADTVAPPDWIERLGGHFDDPRVAAVAPRITEKLLDMGRGRNVPYVPSAALIVRTELAHFDETLRYGEDVDLVWRLLDAGWRVVYEPDVLVAHVSRHRVRRRFHYGSSAAPLHARHPARMRHVRRPRTHTRQVARELHKRGVPRRLALLWTAAVWIETARGVARLAGPYGIGVLWGRIRGIPTIQVPSIP
jgi:GT2 family glycosyltransferase